MKRIGLFLRQRRPTRVGIEPQPLPQTPPQEVGDVHSNDVAMSFVDLPRASASPRASAISRASASSRASSTSRASLPTSRASATPIAVTRSTSSARAVARATSAPNATKNNNLPKYEKLFSPKSAPDALASQSSSYMQKRSMWERKKELRRKKLEIHKERKEWDARLKNLHYLQSFPELEKIPPNMTKDTITVMLKDGFAKTFKFKPFVLNETIIKLLEREFNSEQYKSFEQLLNNDPVKSRVNVKEIYLSVFLSNRRVYIRNFKWY